MGNVPANNSAYCACIPKHEFEHSENQTFDK